MAGVFVYLLMDSRVAVGQHAGMLFKRFSIEDGLTSVNCILKDRAGFLWFGGANGLYRFDGHGFRIFAHDPKDSTSISSDNVLCLYEDDRGKLWVGTMNGGLNQFDPVKEKFIRYLHRSADPSTVSSNRINTLQGDSHGSLWVGTMGGGLDRFDYRTGTFTNYRHDPGAIGSLSNNDVFDVMEDRQGNIWVTTNKGNLDKLEADSQSFVHFSYSDALYRGGRTGQRMIEDDNGKIWIGTEGDGLFSFDKTAHTFEHFIAGHGKGRLSNNVITDLQQKKPGEIWLTTDGGGLNHLDVAANYFTSYSHRIYDPHSLSNNSSYCLLMDEKGALWLGMGDGSVNVSEKHPFTVYKASTSGTDNLSFNVVVSLALDQRDNLWIGTGGGGLDRMSLKTGAFTNYRHNASIAGSLSSNIVLSLCADKTDHLWIGTFLGGLDQLNPKAARFNHYRNEKDQANSLTHNHVFDVIEGADDELWIATHGGGLDCYHRNTNQFIHFRNDPEVKGSLTSDRVLCLLKDRGDNIWIGTLDGGLLKWNRTGKVFDAYNFRDPEEANLREYPIHHLMQDAEGNIWVATGGNGLVKLDPSSGSMTAITRKTRPGSNAVYGSIQDDQRNIWMSTNRGIMRYSPWNESITVFNTSDGLPTNDFESGAIVKAKDELFFGSKNGLVAFKPHTIKTAQEESKVMITELRIFNKPVAVGEQLEGTIPLEQSTLYADQITLPYNCNNFSFEFAAPGSANPEKVRYAYQLEGALDRWIEVDANQRLATFSNISPGEYTFKVATIRDDGAVNPGATSLLVKIQPPLWQTGWAYLLYLTVLAFVIYFINSEVRKRIRLKGELKAEKYLHEKDIELYISKINLYTNISHELRTPLTLIIGPLERLMGLTSAGSRDFHQLTVIHRNCQKLLQMVNQLLDFRKIEAGQVTLQVQETRLVEFVSQLLIPFEELAAHKNIQLVSGYDTENVPVWLDRQKMEIILVNLLSNALKFTAEGGKVTLKVSVENRKDTGKEEVVVAIEDTGRGIPDDQLTHIFDPFYQASNHGNTFVRGTGIGLSITKYLIELHKGSIHASSRLHHGSVFGIRFPAQMEAYPPKERRATGSGEGHGMLPHLRNRFQPAREETRILAKASLPQMLIAEDNDELRAFIKSGFADHYEIMEAPDGLKALNRALDTIPDIIIMDVMMPELNGIEVCGKLKKDERTSHIPIIMLTAKTSVHHQFEGLASGADDYITKPFNFDLLSTRVLNLLESRRKLRERYSQQFLLKPKNIVIDNPNALFLQRVIRVIEENMAEPDFNVELLAREIGMSHSVLYRKVVALTGKPINDFIKSIRLQRAAQLLKQSNLQIVEISDRVGFSNSKYFSTCFKAEFGKTPSEYAAI